MGAPLPPSSLTARYCPTLDLDRLLLRYEEGTNVAALVAMQGAIPIEGASEVLERAGSGALEGGWIGEGGRRDKKGEEQQQYLEYLLQQTLHRVLDAEVCDNF